MTFVLEHSFRVAYFILRAIKSEEYLSKKYKKKSYDDSKKFLTLEKNKGFVFEGNFIFCLKHISIMNHHKYMLHY